MKKYLDARELPCPKPLVLTKKLLQEDDCDGVTVRVDNVAAKENVSRFLTKQGFTDLTVTQEGEEFVISTSDEQLQIQPDEPQNASGNKTLFFTSNLLGSGDQELGALLMKGFIYTLTELEHRPNQLIFMNSAVRLACTGSQVLDDLRQIATSGTQLLVCGTCLDYYQLTEELQVGTISNMYSITEALLEAETMLKIT
ncbi:MAG: sulfurtransferase-like selenium metabolism protein YedF [Spirochaetota bacterium]